MKPSDIKPYLVPVLLALGFGVIVSLLGVVMLSSRGSESVGGVVLKVGIVFVLAAFIATVVLAIKSRAMLTRGKKIAIAILVLLSLPVSFGMIQLLFLL